MRKKRTIWKLVNNPLIIAEKQSSLEKLSVAEAVMKMDLRNLQAFTFINSISNTVSVVSYRADGNISWIDTKVTA